jgi:glycosyltransferase involved in cell wall biosynthesis
MSDEVAFDLRSAAGSPTGVGRHMLSIVRALAECRPDVRVRAYVRQDVTGLPESVRIVRIGGRGPLWHIRVWWHLRRQPVRAYCSTSLVIPVLTRQPCLPVVLDVISFLYPEHQTRRTRLFEGLLMRRAVRRHPLIAGSETTRLDLELLFGPCRAVVVPPFALPPVEPPVVPPVGPAVEPPVEPPAGRKPGEADVLDRFGIHPPYALYIGTVEPRKNVLTAVRAVASLRKAGTAIELVMVGGRGWIDRSTAAELAAAEAGGMVRWTGYVSDPERDAILASAAGLVLPSLYEGFGLPLLEAMGRGVPCVCSTAPAFEEVGGGAVLRAPTFDVDAWAAAIGRLLAEPGLRRELAAAGRERAARYSAAETASAFELALAQLA